MPGTVARPTGTEVHACGFSAAVTAVKPNRLFSSLRPVVRPICCDASFAAWQALRSLTEGRTRPQFLGSVTLASDLMNSQ